MRKGKRRVLMVLASVLVAVLAAGPVSALTPETEVAPAAPAPPPGPTEAVAYQISVSHDGYSGDGTLRRRLPPAGLATYPDRSPIR